MTDDPKVRRYPASARWFFVALWTIPALAGTIDNYVWRRAHGMPVGFWQMVVAEFPKWLIWIPLTPLIFRLGRRYRIAPPFRWRMIALHAAICLGLSAAQAMIVAVPLIALQGSWELGSFLSDALFAFANWLPVMLLVYPALVGLGYALEVRERLQSQQVAAASLSAQLAQAQLSALRAQLHPHMMFNSLNTAVSLVRTGDNALAVDVLTDLGDILRHVLKGASVQEVALSDEVCFVERCMAIEQTRFPSRVRSSIRIDPAVRDALVPNMILQPLVENALRHAVTPREFGGLIEIDAHADAGTLVITVRDDGPGFPSMVAPQCEGLGLSITRERLSRLYDGEGSMRTANRPGGGAEIVLRLPLRFRLADPVPPSETDRSRPALHLAGAG